MQQVLTIKLKILPDEAGKKLLEETMAAYSRACSFVAERIAEDHLPLNRCSIHKAVYRSCREQFSLPSQMSASVIRTVTASFRSIKTSKERHPSRFSKKKRNSLTVPRFRVPQVSLVWNRDYSLMWDKSHTQRLFSVNTLAGRIRVPFRADAFGWAFEKGVVFGTAKLVCRHGKYYLHIPVTVVHADPVPLCPETRVVGLDRGIRFLAVSFDGEKTCFASGAPVKRKRAHYKELRKELQFRRTRSARKRIRSLGQRENRWMGDVNHCLSKAIVSRYPAGTLFVLEDLTGIRSATERVRLKDRYVSVSWAYYDLEQKLKYKAGRAGSHVINTDPAYTSQTCPVCGHAERKNRNHEQHLFRCCKCGYRSNDDRVGAMNLWRMGIQYLPKAQVSA